MSKNADSSWQWWFHIWPNHGIIVFHTIVQSKVFFRHPKDCFDLFDSLVLSDHLVAVGTHVLHVLAGIDTEGNQAASQPASENRVKENFTLNRFPKPTVYIISDVGLTAPNVLFSSVLGPFRYSWQNEFHNDSIGKAQEQSETTAFTALTPHNESHLHRHKETA